MSEGIRATIEFPAPAACTIADVARASGASIDTVWTSVPPNGDASSVSEFLVQTADGPPAADGIEHVLSIGNRHVLRFTHGDGSGCPCQCIGRAGVAIQRYEAREGRLRLVFNAVDFEELRGIMADLRETFPDLDVRRLVRAPAPDQTRDAVYVDRGKLTSRQLEVLRTAYEMGYFERPRKANAGEVAATLGIDPSTFTEHLSVGLRKLLDDVLP